MFGKLFTNIIMALMRPGVDRAVESMREDPDIKQKFKELENALLDLKDATEQNDKYFSSEERTALKKRFGYKDWA